MLVGEVEAVLGLIVVVVVIVVVVFAVADVVGRVVVVGTSVTVAV